MIIEWPSWWRLVNKRFIPLVDSTDRFNILYGSRDSTKSSFIATIMIYKLLSEEYFRHLMIRRVYKSVRGSQFQMMKDVSKRLKLDHLFEFRESGTQVICKLNDNRLMGMGTDDVNQIKSIPNPTGAWYEEDIMYIPEDDWITITTSVRGDSMLQDWYSLNPIIMGQNYEENWFFKRFLAEQYSETNLSFRGETVNTIAEQEIRQAFTVHHSTWRNNRWLGLDRAAFYMDLEKSDPFFGPIYSKGLFTNKTAEGLFYNQFNRAIHVHEIKYDPRRAIHLTFDFNLRPYVSASIWQVYEPDEDHEIVDYCYKHNKLGVRPTVLAKVGEIAARPPENRTVNACEMFAQEYYPHHDALFLYGDPAGKQEDTRSEKGKNDFVIIKRALAAYTPRERVHSAAPNVAKRGEFINEILSGRTDYALVIDPRCKESVMDYTNGKEDMNGRKLKKKVVGEDGVPFEEFHHFSDGDDYFITKYLLEPFNEYLRGGLKPEVTVVKTGFSSRTKR